MNTQKSHIHLLTLFLVFFCVVSLSACQRSFQTDGQESQTIQEDQDRDGLPPIGGKDNLASQSALDLVEDIEQRKEAEESTDSEEDIEGKKKQLIRKGDYYTFKQDHEAAIRAYELAWLLSKKQDTSIAAKMANLYFEQKMFVNAIDFFEKGGVISLPTKDKIQYAKALQYTQDPSITDKITQLDLPDYIYEYFLLSETCIREPIRCEEKILSYSFDYEPGTRLQKAIETYEKLGISDPTYKEALLISAFYANEDYKAIEKIGDRILARRPDYQAVLKLTGYAHYEMKHYDTALKLLEKYKEFDSKDTQIDYIMGLIYAEKEDFVTSNLYLNNAVVGGFEPKDLAERKLAYNYYLLGLEQNMFQVLHHLLMGESSYEEDFTNAVYLAIEGADMRKASMWLARGLEQYPQSAHLLALSGWHLRIIGKPIEAQQVLQEAIRLDRKNSLAYLQLGILAYEEDDMKTAYTNFNRASILDPKGVFGSQVDDYLQKILKREEGVKATIPKSS